jgi:Family of unknown function (DUF5343)
MGLAACYVQAPAKLPDLFKKIRDGQAPDQLITRILVDWGFKSTADRAFIPLLKAIGFLNSDGKPTQRYHDYRDHSKSKFVMADALRDAYADIFLINEKPSNADKEAIEGKFKSFHNASDNVAGLMQKTFYALLALADLNGVAQSKVEEIKPKKEDAGHASRNQEKRGFASTGLHYNIQIHLPATKDTEVYNAIFRSLKEHLLAE